VLVCSHLLPDVERTCDYVAVIDRGRAVLDGPIGELTGAQSRSVRLRVDDPRGAFAAALSAAERRFEREADGALRVALDDGGEDVDELFALAARSGTALQAVEPVRSTLDQVFLRVMTGGAP
jgi:ABC-type multidrug transport system ATPase subunit